VKVGIKLCNLQKIKTTLEGIYGRFLLNTGISLRKFAYSGACAYTQINICRGNVVGIATVYGLDD
jgi:hypothetical protein